MATPEEREYEQIDRRLDPEIPVALAAQAELRDRKARLVSFLQEIVDDRSQTLKRRATAELLKRYQTGIGL
jgi:hypothetical protein